MKLFLLGSKYKILNSDGFDAILIDATDVNSRKPLNQREVDRIIAPSDTTDAKLITENIGTIISLNETEYQNERANINDRICDTYYHNTYFEKQFLESKKQFSIDFSIDITDKSKVISSHLLSNELSEIKDHMGSYFRLIKKKLSNPAEYGPNFYELANCYGDVGDYQQAKEYYIKSTKFRETKSDAWFALACLKVSLNEPFVEELNSAIDSYRNEDHPNLEYALNILNSANSTFNAYKSFIIKGTKKNGKTRMIFSSGVFSPFDVDEAWKEIENLFRTLKYRFELLKINQNGFFEMEVSFVNEFPYQFLRKFQSSGVGFEELLSLTKEFHRIQLQTPI